MVGIKLGLAVLKFFTGCEAQLLESGFLVLNFFLQITPALTAFRFKQQTTQLLQLLFATGHNLIVMLGSFKRLPLALQALQLKLQNLLFLLDNLHTSRHLLRSHVFAQ
ncbi:hypothetical protein D3C75_1220450 [compost metagenome]